jgi:tetratricopeptide (TPR) repeat protein
MLLMGDYDGVQPYLEESLEYSRSAGDRKGEARALAGLGVAAMWQSRFEDAMRVGEQSLALYRELGQQRGIAMALHNLGTCEWALRRPDHGRAKLEKALEMLRESGDEAMEALCLTGLVSTLVRNGETEAALGRARECLALLESLELPREAVFLLDAFAEWLFATGQAGRAARMLGASGTTRAALSLVFMPREREEFEALRARIVAAVGEEETGREMRAGALLSREQALAEVKTLINSVQSD